MKHGRFIIGIVSRGFGEGQMSRSTVTAAQIVFAASALVVAFVFFRAVLGIVPGIVLSIFFGVFITTISCDGNEKRGGAG